MSFVQSFTANQLFSNPTILRLVDTSSGSDAAIAARRVYITNSAGEPVVPVGVTTDYILWPYADSTLSADILTAEFALWIRVDWVNSGATVLYTTDLLKRFDYYGMVFLYSLSQQQAANNDYIISWFGNKSEMMVNEDDAVNAVDIGSDIMSAQNALNRATLFVTNQSLLF